MFENLLRDARLGARVLLKERVFCALAILVLALGICGVTSMFAVVNGVVIRGFSFPNASRLVHVDFVDPTTGSGLYASRRMASMDFVELAAAQQSFTMVAAYTDGETINMTIDGEPRRHEGACVTPDFFRILGIDPALGRNFRTYEQQTSVLRLVDHADLIDKTVYALTNPCKDNLVAKVIDWPGVNSFQASLNGETLTAVRPAHELHRIA